jgi:hypothetical protein
MQYGRLFSILKGRASSQGLSGTGIYTFFHQKKVSTGIDDLPGPVSELYALAALPVLAWHECAPKPGERLHETHLSVAAEQ